MRIYKNKLLNFAYWRYLDLRNRAVGYMGKAATKEKFDKNLPGRPHGLPGQLIVSVASYPPRFADLPYTLMALMTQSVRADKVVLYIPDEYQAQLPADVLALRARGLEILGGPNYRSYGKLIPVLKKYPDAFIVTADDDVYYTPEWLGGLVECWNGEKTVVGHNGHWVQLDAQNRLLPTETWPAVWEQAEGQKEFYLPIGEGGILYPPHIFHPDIMDEATFLEISREVDDFWFYWMAMRGGARYIPTKRRWITVTWPSSQNVGLSQKKDLDAFYSIKLGQLYDKYGWPGQKAA